MFAALGLLLLVLTAAAPDTLVVCRPEYRPALAEWEQYRRRQGHVVAVVPPASDATQLKRAVRSFAGGGRLKYLVLVGDVAGAAESDSSPARGVHTNYLPAKINTRWGSEPLIASDAPYGDVDDDGLPDVAIGRIAAESAEELDAVVGKIIRYERAAEGPGEEARRLDVVSGSGGFGPLTDAVIESAARLVFQQTVPAGYEVRHTPVHSAQAGAGAPGDVRGRVREQIGRGGFAWVYLGHGLPTQLDRVRTPVGERPLLAVEDVTLLRCGARSPLMVLVACYTGAMDSPQRSLAEELSLSGGGPVAVVAATRVTMPYGNTVFGYELLRACFAEETETLGDVLLRAQRRTWQQGEDDPLRESLDAMCRGLSPPPLDLAAERREHVLMYHLLGDPLLRLRRPADDDLKTALRTASETK